MNFASFNCYGFRNFQDLKSRLLQFDILFLCETWLIDEPPAIDSAFKSFFFPATRDHLRGRAAGGAIILIRSTIPARLIFTGEHIYTVSIEIAPRITLACVYWCPTASVAVQLEELTCAINHAGSGCFLAIGDFNCRIGTTTSFLMTFCHYITAWRLNVSLAICP